MANKKEKYHGDYSKFKKAAKPKKPRAVKREFEKKRPIRDSRAVKHTDKINLPSNEEIRLNKYIAHSGLCSRREADQLIANGKIKVNNKVVLELGAKVKLQDRVEFEGKYLNPEKQRYFLLNKPKDFITTTDDPHAKKTVMDLLKKACTERIYPVGRLDRNTTGVLLFTNDGELAKKLTHPSHNIKKMYKVVLDKELEIDDFEKIKKGIELEDGLIKADGLEYIKGSSKNEIGIEIHSGRNRIVRRIFESLNYDVKYLDRVVFAGLTKKDLPRGRFRALTDKEIGFLKMIK